MIRVFTNGVFDILHVGHVRLLQFCRGLGDEVVVGINSDESVKALKGPERPINSLMDRTEVLLALRVVDSALPFNEKRCDDLIRKVRPAIYVKGGDYTMDSLDSGEREALLGVGAKILFFPMVHGKSTTRMVNQAGDIREREIARQIGVLSLDLSGG